jgi:hypothetical protein
MNALLEEVTPVGHAVLEIVNSGLLYELREHKSWLNKVNFLLNTRHNSLNNRDRIAVINQVMSQWDDRVGEG